MSNNTLEARHELGLSIAEMARALGIHRQTWIKWERGEQRPPAVAITAMRMLAFISLRGLLGEWQTELQNSGRIADK